MNVKLSKYIDDADIEYNMVECYYEDFCVYVIDYDHLGKEYDLETIYSHLEQDIINHAIPCAQYADKLYLVDYAYYLDFHPIKKQYE